MNAVIPKNSAVKMIGFFNQRLIIMQLQRAEYFSKLIITGLF